MTSSINLKAKSDMFNFVLKAKGNIQKVNKEVMLEIGRRLVDYSVVGNPALWHPPYWPKGYNPGHFINNWQVGIDQKPVGEIVGEDPSGQLSLQRLQKLGRWTVGHTYYFVNNVKYAMALEMGHSSQAPQGFVGRVQVELQQIVRDATDRVARAPSKAFEDNG